MQVLLYMDIVLASASPRREELLALIVKDFRIIPSEFDESLVPVELGPKEHVAYSSIMKARDVVGKCPDSLVIGADTIVCIDNAILGKPSDAADAIQMLKKLSGRTHQVCTGVAVIKDGIERSAVEITDVTFREIDDDIIARYVASGEPMDKAGAYAIQGKGAILVKSICGCYSNVVGLPIYRLSTILEEIGVKLLG